MTTPRKIFVRARDGVRVDFHRQTLPAAGGVGHRLYGRGVKSSKHPGDRAVEVDLDHDVRRRLRAGDLLEVDAAEAARMQVDEIELEPGPAPHAERMLAPLEADSPRPRLPGLPSTAPKASKPPPGVPSSGGKQED